MRYFFPNRKQTACPLRIQLFGAQADRLLPEIKKHASLTLVDKEPEIIVCYGGDGTLLDAELRWPGLPKVPVLNSQRGHRCIPHPAKEVIERLAQHALVCNNYTKLECAIYHYDNPEPDCLVMALNEFSVHMGYINSAVRFRLWFDDIPYENGLEILGDGFVVSTPFGSTAYYNQITRGVFTHGIGVAFKYTNEHTNHIVQSDDIVTRVEITRGPAVLAFDSSRDYFDLDTGDTLIIRKYPQDALLLTCAPVTRLDEPF